MKQQGLTSRQVEELTANGQKNALLASALKHGKILYESFFTLFNLLNFLIAIALALVGAWSNMVFILIILLNLVIGIAQSRDAKKSRWMSSRRHRLGGKGDPGRPGTEHPGRGCRAWRCAVRRWTADLL